MGCFIISYKSLSKYLFSVRTFSLLPILKDISAHAQCPLSYGFHTIMLCVLLTCYNICFVTCVHTGAFVLFMALFSWPRLAVGLWQILNTCLVKGKKNRSLRLHPICCFALSSRCMFLTFTTVFHFFKFTFVIFIISKSL